MNNIAFASSLNIQDYLNAVQMLAPQLWLVGAVIIAALWNLFVPQAKNWTPLWCLLGLCLAAGQFCQQFGLAPTSLLGSPGPFVVDKLTVGFGLLSCFVGVLVVLMTMGYEHQLGSNRGEFYAIL